MASFVLHGFRVGDAGDLQRGELAVLKQRNALAGHGVIAQAARMSSASGVQRAKSTMPTA